MRRAREVRSAGLCLASFGAACHTMGWVVASTHPVKGYGVGAESRSNRGFGVASEDGERGSCAGFGGWGSGARRAIEDPATTQDERERDDRRCLL